MDLCVGTATAGKSVNTILKYIERVNVKQKIAKIFIAHITTHPKNNDKKWVNISNYSRDVELQTSRQLITIPCSITKGPLNLASQALRLLHLHLLHRRSGQEFMLQVLRTGPQGMEVFNLKLLTQVASKITCPWRLNLSYLQVWEAYQYQTLILILLLVDLEQLLNKLNQGLSLRKTVHSKIGSSKQALMKHLIQTLSSKGWETFQMAIKMGMKTKSTIINHKLWTSKCTTITFSINRENVTTRISTKLLMESLRFLW